MIAALPTAGGAAMIILALEHSAQFISQSAVGSLIANAACALFALSYAALAQKHGLRLSLGGAFLVWLVTVFLLRLVDWSATGAVILNAVIYPLAIVAARRYRIPGAAKRVKVTGADLAWRALVVTFCVVAVTAASSSIGSYFSGVFAFFPVAMGSFFIILQPRIGGPAAASVAAHVLTPLIGLGLGLLAVHLLAVPIGVWWSYVVGLSIGLAWNALLWLLREWRIAKRLTSARRHARACRGHPRLRKLAVVKGVDGRDKRGHDGCEHCASRNDDIVSVLLPPTPAPAP